MGGLVGCGYGLSIGFGTPVAGALGWPGLGGVGTSVGLVKGCRGLVDGGGETDLCGELPMFACFRAINSFFQGGSCCSGVDAEGEGRFCV